MTLPIKTTESDIEAVVEYLDSKVGYVPLDQVRSVLSSRLADARKIEAMRFIGLLERKDDEVRLTDAGHAWARGDSGTRQNVIADLLRQIDLYSSTVEWMHHGKNLEPSKTQIAQYWHDKQSSRLDGSAGAALTDGVVYFMRLFGMAGLGKFTAAGLGRDTHLEGDAAALAAFANAPAGTPPPRQQQHPEGTPEPTSRPSGTPSSTPPPAGVSTDVNINVQIHIAADAKPDVIRDIFKNMRRYVLNQPDIKEESK